MTWDLIRLEIAKAGETEGRPQHDPIRRAKITAAEKISGVPLVVYASDFTDAGRVGQNGAGQQPPQAGDSGGVFAEAEHISHNALVELNPRGVNGAMVEGLQLSNLA